MNAMEVWAEAWIVAKADEAAATARRRVVEDQMAAVMELDATQDGTTTVEPKGYIIKITGRIDRKVDGDKVQELAAEFGLTEHLAKLFRWKPEINLAIWKAADESITKPLASAITAKPGRPSFTISHKE